MSHSKSRFSKTIRVALGVAALSGSMLAHAEYRLSVFDNARAHDALHQSDLAAAAAAFEKPNVEPLDYADLNNRCVLEIVERNIDSATQSCRMALSDITSRQIRLRDKRKMRSVVLSNLSVALMHSGNYADAEARLERSLVLDSDNKVAASNRKVLAQSKIAAN